MSTQNPTPDYSGLSKQEVAERLKNPTPDATATPRQVWEAALAAFMAQPEDRMWGEAAAEVIAGTLEPLRAKIANQAERIRYLEGATNHATGTPLSHARARVDTLECELTSAKAEIARVTADFDRVTNTLYDRVNDVIALKSRAERAEAQLRERTQWQCKCGGTDCAGQAENERLRAEVTKLKAHEGDLVIGAAILEGARKQEAREVDQLRARVAALEQDEARLDWLAREPYPRMSEVRSLMALTGYPTAEAKDLIRAAIDAARDGRGAT